MSKGSMDKKPIMQGVPYCSSFASPAFRVMIAEAWFDSIDGCVGGERLSSSKKKHSRKRRRDGFKRRVFSRISKRSLDKKPITPYVTDCSTFTNVAFDESIEEAWFDSNVVFDFDYDDV
ncbi:uncharacterized protein G2W53_027562 [Senna tora]|uniref:Uncharacterized protein n=1 Tax=Senna tora TaxID=362788 RepID=A0A834TIX8_9FABA|nr:uncharacterized protein G2W53_027562 [Senna tora]